MIKIRLWGELNEITELKEYLKTLPRLRLTYSSEPCADRGESAYKRIYIEASLRSSETPDIANSAEPQEREVLQALIENLYYSLSEENGRLVVYSPSKLARAYSIAKQLCEFDLVDKQEVEDFVNKYSGEVVNAKKP